MPAGGAGLVELSFGPSEPYRVALPRRRARAAAARVRARVRRRPGADRPGSPRAVVKVVAGGRGADPAGRLAGCCSDSRRWRPVVAGAFRAGAAVGGCRRDLLHAGGLPAGASAVGLAGWRLRGRLRTGAAALPAHGRTGRGSGRADPTRSRRRRTGRSTVRYSSHASGTLPARVSTKTWSALPVNVSRSSSHHRPRAPGCGPGRSRTRSPRASIADPPTQRVPAVSSAAARRVRWRQRGGQVEQVLRQGLAQRQRDQRRGRRPG